MNKLFTIFIITLITNNLVSQKTYFKTNINRFIKLEIESIERNITINNWGSDTTHKLNYSITNLTSDSITYITNSCFYYNHFSMIVNDIYFDLNAEGGCTINSLNFHSLAPNKKVNLSDNIDAFNLKKIKNGESNISIVIPVVKEKNSIRVDGRNLIENSEKLIFEGKTKIITNNRSQWVNDIDRLIEQLTYAESNPSKESFINSKKYNSFHFEELDVDSLGLEIDYYFNKNRIIKSKTYSFIGCFCKPRWKKGDPLGSLIEIHQYYSNKSKGIQYNRAIEIYEGFSLVKEKKKLESIELKIKKNLNKEDYKFERKMFKGLKKENK